MAGMQESPSGERVQIGFFGCRNAGKSSLCNAVTGQPVSIVSPVKGTTTDPVMKAMELLPLGPVSIIDTPGFDDAGALGELRMQRVREALGRCDLAVLVVDASCGMRETDKLLLRMIEERGIPYITAWNKCDLPGVLSTPEGAMAVSAAAGEGIFALKEKLGRLLPKGQKRPLVRDLVSPGGLALLVCPIDAAAPAGRLILPQQMVLRELLDNGSMALVLQPGELAGALRKLSEPPALVVTDSQVFREVAKILPPEIPLTSFSILMARYKSFLRPSVDGIGAVRRLRDGSRVLMAEGCTHHRQCGDIGTVKIPGGLRRQTRKELAFDTASGQGFPSDLSPYSLVIHCGGCMLTEGMLRQRMELAARQGVPFTNYGIALASMAGILERSLRPFPEIHALLGKA